MKVDILIKNGTTVDLANQDFVKNDIGIIGDRIVDIEGEAVDAETVIDAENCFVLPGLIDYHLHAFHDGTAISVNADVICLPNGVTSVVDAGSSGWVNFPAFKKHVITQSLVKIKSYLNMVNVGLSTLGGGPTGYLENINPANFNLDKIKATVQGDDNILGLKLRYSKDLCKDKGFSTDPFDETVKLARELNTNFCVHVTDSTKPLYELVSSFDKGDVLAHCFHGVGHTILDEDNKVYPQIKAAQERGVVFDCSNGVAHFDFKVAQAALDDGFYPDIISTDLTLKNSLRTDKVFSLLFVMSKYINMGMPLFDIIKAVTTTPANLMGMDGQIGVLSPGAFADVAIVKMKKKKVTFSDTGGNELQGDCYLDNLATICNGNIVYRKIHF
ncbi:metallo-dependent hydrolase [Vibrio gazogenes]|uniref:Predicted amidohydrolase n=2 Tax=Vibrio gazogenes TaxID=687 RepID=A0A1M5C4T4_VIBGA|nr:metallo-dependent hydrolase [Vibrio gazogenes]USP15370.1 metallo-dependent hydrolase [Vibrio gazogenes]SHF49759.1 Predicted amidohydrolase [Vibrio gazogenes DSM 21264] [Vibrio gazogenes DSM 21264 = NBRC 103151]